MKSVLRSCFDPIPRFMSMRSLAGLVAMVVVGTGISVYEYLESSRPTERAPVREQVSDCSSEDRIRARCEVPTSAWRAPGPAHDVTIEPRSEATSDAMNAIATPYAPPSVFEPAEQAGS